MQIQPTPPAQTGISLYTLLAAVVVLGVLTSVLVTSFSGTHSKGEALWALMHNLGQAANRFHLDTSCWPAGTDTLWDYTQVTSASAGSHQGNSCETTLPKSSWHGPYIKRFKLNNDLGNSSITQFGPKAEIQVTYFASNHHPVIRAINIPEDIAKEAYEACGGDGSMCTMKSDTEVHYYYSGNLP